MTNNETIADIIAWLRKPIEGENAYLTAWRDEIADRLEAAIKRERAKIEADALEVGGILEAAHKRELSKDVSKNGADFGQLGDVAKLREALEKVIEIADREWNAFRETSAMWEMREICVAALAATEKEGGAK